jgi:ferredoxin
MARLDIDLSSCVRVMSKNSTCTSCADICPNDSITFSQNIISLDRSCDDCSLCIGECPTEAIALKDVDTIESSFNFLKSDATTLSCKEDIECIGIFSIEYLLAIAIMKKGDTLILESCPKCYEIVLKRSKEVDFILNSLQLDKSLDVRLAPVEDSKDIKSRRDFLKKLTLQEPLDSSKEFSNLSGRAIKQKILPNKRKLLFMALKRVGKVEFFEDINPTDISFISKKVIDNSCDNCSFCYRLCPSGALSSNSKNSKIDFDVGLCLKCHLCHDLCESDSIELDIFSTRDMLSPEVKTLKEFDVRRCEECGVVFTPKSSEKMCRRCTIEDEEARELWGM